MVEADLQHPCGTVDSTTRSSGKRQGGGGPASGHCFRQTHHVLEEKKPGARVSSLVSHSHSSSSSSSTAVWLRCQLQETSSEEEARSFTLGKSGGSQAIFCLKELTRTVRVWLKRDSGQYWPSIYHAMPSPCSCMSFNPETRRLSIGLDNGTISEFILSEDYNKMTLVKSYQAHQSRVIMILFVLEMEWVLSTGQDKHFTWHCSESGQRLGGYRTSAGACGLQFDVETRHVFVGDHSGQVTILKLEQESCSLVTTFKGHTGGVTALCWDPIQRVLFSGSSDHSIIMWDIGGRKGTAIELQGHNDKVQSLSYAHHTRQLISCGADGGIVVWNMDVERQETPEWLDSDSCQKCDQPFFWNFKQMWDSKKIGLRQHHCRKCGKAVCGKCSSKRSSIPLMGFEFEVRVCDSCHESITDEERAPTATFHDSKHNIVHVHFDATRGWLLTSGTDKVIKLWDMTPVVS
ncbi:PREDICTED: WD repeat and FYVE domain-containing protein 2 [Corvus brachyrhynchos]|nr:PREDICTED: WD repeat and FYVE domain-containing protein 2 [Corvus brachyrhynchos]